MLPRHARCVLSRLRCNGHSLLLSSYLSRIGRIENPCCSACGHSVPGHLSSHSALSSYGLFAPLTLWRLSVSLRPLVQTLGSCPGLTTTTKLKTTRASKARNYDLVVLKVCRSLSRSVNITIYSSNKQFFKLL